MSPRHLLVDRSARRVRGAVDGVAKLATRVAPPLMRLALALPFLRSGLTRWDGFLVLSPGTSYLFEDQFKLHVLGAEYGLPVPGQLAWLTACAEIALPVLLLVGLGTRFAALALLTMTAVIQLVFPDGWANFHLYWAALALGITTTGPGALSIDRWIDRAVARP
ncbi:putative membrane protein [Caulobacter sp. AP07]|uniref:DoxX family protein n=1 Tax=Caulobacter sp. AP07 TaxID=1144304 RepID=UPI000271DA54|nr:DoxX family protein [Caulobacter sp. AP07]EJL26611.1 putative membrane protein [Caulobacter sp. AP07]